MPMIRKPLAPPAKDEAETPEKPTLTLFNENDELTLAGGVIADFLEEASWDDVIASDAARPFLANPAVSEDDPLASEAELEEMRKAEETGTPVEEKNGDYGKKGDEKGKDDDEDDDADEDDDKDESAETTDEDADESFPEVVLPGVVAAQLIDESDTLFLFEAYLRDLSERAETVEERASLAVFQPFLDEDADEPTIAEEHREAVVGLIRDVLSEALIVEDAETIDEAFLTRAQSKLRARKAKKPKTGKKRRELLKRKKMRKRNKAKVQRQEKKLRRKRKARNKMLAKRRASESAIDDIVLGLGEGLTAAELRIAVAEDAKVELTDEDRKALIEAGVIREAKTEEDAKKSETSESEQRVHRLDPLNEGHSLAGGVLAKMGHATKPASVND